MVICGCEYGRVAFVSEGMFRHHMTNATSSHVQVAGNACMATVRPQLQPKKTKDKGGMK